MRIISLFFGLVCLASLAACGFEPLYGTHQGALVGAEEKLAQVEIGDIPNREGQYLRNALIDRFYRSGRPVSPAYILKIDEMRERESKLDVTKTADATRGQLRYNVHLSLHDASSGKVLLERNLLSVASYNILDSEFATRVTEDNARLNALQDLATQIELQLNLYFRHS
jgi:LPS-assembly lipoprotein